MFCFHVLFLGVLLASLLSSIGLFSGFLLVILQGTSDQSLDKDAFKNGTFPVYVIMLIFQALLFMASMFGFILCWKTWKNSYQLDKALRSWFTLWIVFWVIAFLGILTIGTYAIVREKDALAQLDALYEIFKSNLLDAKYISAFLKYQRQHECCGIYGSDDWLVAQLQNINSDGTHENPSTGNCHLSTKTIPSGCGEILLQTVNPLMKLFGILTLLELVFGVAAGIIAAYSFCYWLNNDVIVIPEDEVGDVIVVEPPERDQLDKKHHWSNTANLFKSKKTIFKSKIVHLNGATGHGTRSGFGSKERSHFASHVSALPPGMKSVFGNEEEFSSVESFMEVPSPSPESAGAQDQLHPLPEHIQSARKTGPREALLEKEENAVLKGVLHGGKVVGEMRVEHKFDKDGKPIQDPDDKKKATLMIVRNKKVAEQSHPPPGRHGQTGHLAEDIAEMSGKNARAKIEDVIIPELQGKHHQNKEQDLLQQNPGKSRKLMFGSVTGDAAQLDIENMIDPAHLRAEEEQKEKMHEEEANAIRPRYLHLQPHQHQHQEVEGPVPVHPLEHHVNSQLLHSPVLRHDNDNRDHHPAEKHTDHYHERPEEHHREHHHQAEEPHQQPPGYPHNHTHHHHRRRPEHEYDG